MNAELLYSDVNILAVGKGLETSYEDTTDHPPSRGDAEWVLIQELWVVNSRIRGLEAIDCKLVQGHNKGNIRS